MTNTEGPTGEVSPVVPTPRPNFVRRGRSRGDGRLPRHYLWECVENARRVEMERPNETCTWPACLKPKAHSDAYGEEVPLCIEHVYETWRIARDLADRKQNREQTRVTVSAETVRVIEQPVSKIGWIYYLRIGDSIKVGYASNLDNRLKAYPPSAEFLFAHPGTKATEKSTHSMLYLWRNAGREWYDDRAEVLDYLEKMKRRYAEDAQWSDPRPPKSTPKGQVVAMRRRSGANYTR